MNSVSSIAGLAIQEIQKIKKNVDVKTIEEITSSHYRFYKVIHGIHRLNEIGVKAAARFSRAEC